MRKADVGLYILDRIDHKKQEIRKEAGGVIKLVTERVAEAEFPSLRQIDSHISSLLRALEAFHGNRSISHLDAALMRDLNKPSANPIRGIIHAVGIEVTNRLIHKQTADVSKLAKAVIEVVEPQIAEALEKYHALDKLRKEVAVVVDTAPNGKRAYERLVELGVDMSGFTAAPSQLPALVTLSVDPGILNG